VGSTDAEWAVDHLFLDSLLFLKVLPAGAHWILDLGAGAGLPGVPLKIVSAELRLTLLEGRQRRASFLRAVVRQLSLASTEVVNARAEDVVDARRGTVDAVVMRCAGPVENLLSLGREFVRPGGVVIASGPPVEVPLAIGRWVTVRSRVLPDRRFAVLRKD